METDKQIKKWTVRKSGERWRHIEGRISTNIQKDATKPMLNTCNLDCSTNVWKISISATNVW